MGTAAVKYTGPLVRRVITPDEWRRRGTTGTKVTFDRDNNFTVQKSDLTAGQITALTGMGEFNVGALDPTGVDLRRCTLAIGSPRTAIAAGVLVDWGERIPVLLPVKTKRWRLKVGNHVLLPTAASEIRTQRHTISDIVLGTITGISAQGRPVPSFTVAPVKVADGGLTPADGTDWVSAWVEDPLMQFGPDDVRTVGLTISATNNGNGMAFTNSHLAFRRNSAGAAGSLLTLAATGYRGDTLALDKRIEYEFEGGHQVALIVGPSDDEGYNTVAALDGAGQFEPVLTHETWPGAWGIKKRICTINAGITGATQTPFLNKNGLAYSRFDLATTVPDMAIMSMGGNHIIANAGSAATAEAETYTVVQQLKGLGIKKIFGCTIGPPGLAVADAKDVQRVAYNTWMRNNPLGLTGIIDFDVALRDPADKQKQLTELLGPDVLHPNIGGYQRKASVVNVG